MYGQEKNVVHSTAGKACERRKYLLSQLHSTNCACSEYWFTTVWFSHTTTSHLMWTNQLTLHTTPWLHVQTLSKTLSPSRHGNTETLKTSNKCSIIPTMLANFYQFFLILCLGPSLEGSGPPDFPLTFELMCSYAYVFLLVSGFTSASL